MLTIALTFCLAGCGGINGGTEFEVVSAIDLASVTEEDGFVRFTAVGADGITIRFQGVGIEVTEDAIVMNRGARLFSLDYMGQLTGFSLKSSSEDCWISFGFAFSSVPSVNDITGLTAAMPLSVLAGKDTIDLLPYHTGFLVLQANSTNAEPLVIEKLTLHLDTDVPQTLLEELATDSEAYLLLQGHAIDWSGSENLVPAVNIEQLALEKIEESNVLRSDIIAGIDHSSIVLDGTTTFFSSTMSDGAVVRFEAEHIDISEAGITIYPDSVVTSLDAVGKIYAYFPTVENWEDFADDYENWLDVGYGYTYSASKTSVARAEEVHTWSMFGLPARMLDGQCVISTVTHDPNFVYMKGDLINNTKSFVVSGLEVCYDPTEKVTAVTDITLNSEFAASYLEGELYDTSVEQSADRESKAMSFYLILKQDTELADLEIDGRAISFVPKEFYEVGPLRDAAGNELDKATALVEQGCTLEITVGDYTLQMELPVLERYDGAQTMNDLVPYAYPRALGDLNTLVVPVIWADQTNMANNDTLKLFREGIGRIVDENGTVTDYSVTTDEKFSLSEYYDIASYGKMKITSFMTDWYYSGLNYADEEGSYADDVFVNSIVNWVRETYPDLDWSKYDQDANGYIDSMILLISTPETVESYFPFSFAGAYNNMCSYFGDEAGTADAPRANSYSSVSYHLILNDYSAIIHEFAHGLGLIDYYDVNYSGIDAVGSFDMQSASLGDWNAYSKYAVGWMDPQVVQGLASGESVEYTIGSSALTDDVIIIPAAGAEFDGPFGEYVMIDLFSDAGVNEYDADLYNLEDVAGVRISHVNANMEKRTELKDSVTNPGESAEYTIGTVHIANEFKGTETDRYNIEVIQAGGSNTFTCANDPDRLFSMLTADDLFYAGDTFQVEDYSEFFYEGLMDNGSVFGYTVEIIRVGTDANGDPSATIRITAQ